MEKEFHGILISITPKYSGTFSRWSTKSCSGWKKTGQKNKRPLPKSTSLLQRSQISSNNSSLQNVYMKTSYLCWTDVSHSDNTEWIDWYFTKPTNAFTHYERNTTNMDIQDDEISVPLRFDEEDLKRTNFDKWLSYIGIVNQNNLPPKEPKCKADFSGCSVHRVLFLPQKPWNILTSSKYSREK